MRLSFSIARYDKGNAILMPGCLRVEFEKPWFTTAWAFRPLTLRSMLHPVSKYFRLSHEDFSKIPLKSEYEESTPPASSLGPSLRTGGVDSSTSQPRSRSVSKTGRHQGRIRLTEYRDLLNSVIADVNSQNHETNSLASSHIGASYWTSTEKEALFSALALYGCGELPSLASAITTKSIPEIKAFLNLLDHGVAEANAILKPHEAFSLVDVPAAVEIGEECELALNTAADALAQIVHENDLKAEQRKHGKWCLIDHVLADELDEYFDANEENNDRNSSVARGAQDEVVDESHNASDLATVQAAELLRPSSFLRLAMEVFMNGQPNTGTNWRDFIIDGESRPSMLRTALDDFHNLAVSITRRLVQVTLYQTMSRLRANDTLHSTWRPVEAVNRIDVETATDILGLSVNWDQYWAKLPRRAGVNVTSMASKYKDGRESVNNTVTLTYEEVESEMGLALSLAAESQAQDDLEFGHGITKDFDLDSDWYTDVTVSESGELDLELDAETEQATSIENGLGPAHDSESSSGNDILLNAMMKPEPIDSEEEGLLSELHLHAASAQSHSKTEDQFLNAIDHSARFKEERRLWDIVGRTPAVKLEPVDVYQAPSLKRRVEETIEAWRSKTQFQAEWERFGGVVAPVEFQATEMSGRFKRARKTSMQSAMGNSSASGTETNLPLRDVGNMASEGGRYRGESNIDVDVDDMQVSSLSCYDRSALCFKTPTPAILTSDRKVGLRCDDSDSHTPAEPLLLGRIMLSLDMPHRMDSGRAATSILLRLPQELRNEVYRHLFGHDLTYEIIHSNIPRGSYRQSLDTFTYTNDSTFSCELSPLGSSVDYYVRDSLHLALLETCKQINTEAHLLAFSLTSFHVAGDYCQPEPFKQLLQRLPAPKSHVIRNLTLTARVAHLRALNETWCGEPFGHAQLRLDTLTIVPRRPDASATCFGEIADLSQSHTLAYVLAETLKQLRHVRVLEVQNHGCFKKGVWRILYRGLVYRLWRWGGAKCGVRFECGPRGTVEVDEEWFQVHISRMGEGEERLGGLEAGDEIARLSRTMRGMPDHEGAGARP
nr:hypothetical protein CFP56_43701 [Quercus suber]